MGQRASKTQGPKRSLSAMSQVQVVHSDIGVNTSSQNLNSKSCRSTEASEESRDGTGSKAQIPSATTDVYLGKRQWDTTQASIMFSRALQENDEEEVLTLRGQQAQQAMDRIYEVILPGSRDLQRLTMVWQTSNEPFSAVISQSTTIKIKNTLQRIMRRLSYSSGCLPTSLKLKGVTCPDTHTYGAGGYAEVYCGRYNGNKVALKRLLVFQMKENLRKPGFRKVCSRGGQ